MQWPGGQHDRGLKRCSRCWSWFVGEGSHQRFCIPCRVEDRAALVFVEPSHRTRNDEESAKDAVVATDAT
jgi:hypothetical protein